MDAAVNSSAAAERLKTKPLRYLRFKAAFVLLLAFASLLITVAIYRVQVNNYERTKSEELRGILELVDAFMQTYNEELGAPSRGEHVTPFTFRANALELFNSKVMPTDQMRIYLVGVPGREIARAPTDPAMAEIVGALANGRAREFWTGRVDLAGQTMFRVVSPSRASAKSCADCHNEIQGNRFGWQTGSILGAFVVDSPIEEFTRTATISSVVVGFSAFLAILIVGSYIYRLQFDQVVLNTEKRTLAANLTEIETSRREALAANKAKSDFFAMVSHELRSPLTAILGFSDLIAGQTFGTVQRRYIEYARMIHESGGYLLRVINDILDLAKADSGKIELSEEWIDVTITVDSCLSIIAVRADEGGIALSQDVPGGIGVFVDSLRLKQILINLLTNAVKFTPSGGRVRLTVATTPETFEIEISDTGCGMAPEDIPKALAPYGQVGRGAGRRSGSTGLGLPLAKLLTELHGGALEVDSALGVGTTVKVRLPGWRARSEWAGSAELDPGRTAGHP